MYNQIFFTNVLRLLDERGITKSELADRADMSVSYLSDLTNGHANPSLEIMENIAAALEIALPVLLVFLSCMMVSEVKYPSFKTLHFRKKGSFVKILIGALAVGFFLIMWEKILPVLAPVIFTVVALGTHPHRYLAAALLTTGFVLIAGISDLRLITRTRPARRGPTG